MHIGPTHVDNKFCLHDSFLNDIESFLQIDNSNNSNTTTYLCDNDDFSNDDSISFDLEHIAKNLN